MKKMRTHTFRGYRYHVETDKVITGFAEIPRAAPARVLYVAKNLPPLEHLEVAVHEAMHAEDPEAPERVIERRGKSISRFLWRLGYRRVGPGGGRACKKA